jgi:hypothetical protein
MDIYTAGRRLPYIKKNVFKNCGIFGGNLNLYAPLYRQASFASIKLPEADKKDILKYSLSDITQAFFYYLKHYNSGRPFVLAGHSQGSRLLRELIKTEFKNKEISQKLIAAYLIGAEVTGADLSPWFKLAENADDTGIVITYNTQAPGAKGSPVFERGGALNVNPLNWAARPAAKSLNKGAVFFDREGSIAEEFLHFTSAYIEGEGLVAPDVDRDKYSVPLFPKGVYHIYDYEFFYKNLQSNFQRRLNNYKTKIGL